MFGLSQISWGSFLLVAVSLWLGFNGAVWLYFRFKSNSSPHAGQVHRQQKFKQSLPF
jgi:hypothetical protein